MSDEDIQLISNLLLGISNIDKNIQTNSINNLQNFYKQKYDVFLFCLLNIIEKTTKSVKNEQILLRNTSLVICRKIIEITEYEEWEKIDNFFKNKIKNKILLLLNNEIFDRDNMKLFDIIIELFSKIFENEEIWPELLNLILSIFNYDPQQGDSNSNQIIALLYIIKGGINFLYKKFSDFMNRLINYIQLLFNSSKVNINVKILAGELVYEMISLSTTSELDIIKILIKNIIILLLNCYKEYEINKISERYIKSTLQILINIESVESSLLEIYFKDIFDICNNIIQQKNFEDQKIREMAFELLISCIEDSPELIEESDNYYNILYSIFRLMLEYSFEFDKNIEINSSNYLLDINDDFEEYFIEEEINFICALSERIFENIDKNYYEKVINDFVKEYFNKSWKHQYIILIIIISYSKYNNDLNLFQQLFECFSDLLNSSENKVRFSSLYCFKIFLMNYKHKFFVNGFDKIFISIISLLNNENNIPCKYELLISLKYIIKYNNSTEFFNNTESIITILMNTFIEPNINANIRKLVLMNILEINKKRNNEIINSSLNKIDINALLKYFINLFDIKIDFNLYSILLETIVLLGAYNEGIFDKLLPDIFSYLIKLMKLFETMNKKSSIIMSLSTFAKTFKKIFPILIKSNIYQNYINELMQILISLIKNEKNIYFESTKNNIMIASNNDDNDSYSDENTEKGELSSLLLILLSILTNIDKESIQSFLNIIENDIFDLIDYPLDKKSKNMLAKILSKIIYLSNNKDNKSLTYINILLNMIEKETEESNVINYFKQIKEILEINVSKFLNKNQLNSLFDKLYDFINNLEIKKNQLIEKENMKNINKINNKDDINDKIDNKNSIKLEIENLEDIQTEIIEIFGILLKEYKNECNHILEKIIKNIIPNFLNSNRALEIKLALDLCDDLILYLGQEQLIENIWDSLYEILIKFVLYEDNPIRQISSYGIGIFAQKTTINFVKYSKGLIDSLFQALNYSIFIKEEQNKEEDDDFFMALDNIVAAIGKIIFYHYDDIIVKERLNDLIKNWIMNLPLIWDETEWINQHEWMVNLFFNQKDLIPLNCYNHYFQTLAEIYKTKYSNNNIDKNIENIFTNFVKKDQQLLNILSDVYENASPDIKLKLNILAGQN